MKQIQDLGVSPDFSLAGTGKMETALVSRLLQQLKKRLQQLCTDQRELLISAAAACTIGLSVLLVSYLFLSQLAAYGW